MSGQLAEEKRRRRQEEETAKRGERPSWVGGGFELVEEERESSKKNGQSVEWEEWRGRSLQGRTDRTGERKERRKRIRNRIEDLEDRDSSVWISRLCPPWTKSTGSENRKGRRREVWRVVCWISSVLFSPFQLISIDFAGFNFPEGKKVFWWRQKETRRSGRRDGRTFFLRRTTSAVWLFCFFFSLRSSRLNVKEAARKKSNRRRSERKG